MSLTVTVMELNQLSEEEVEKVKKMSYADIWWDFNEFFCIPAENGEKEEYKATLPFCTKIMTNNGIEAYVAKCHYHSNSSDRLLGGCISSLIEGNVENWTNITELCEVKINGSETVNDDSEKGYHIRELEYTLPKLSEQAGLFFRVS